MTHHGKFWTCHCRDDRTVKLDVDALQEYSGYFRALLNSQMFDIEKREINLPLFTSYTVKHLAQIFRFSDLKATHHNDNAKKRKDWKCRNFYKKTKHTRMLRNSPINNQFENRVQRKSTTELIVQLDFDEITDVLGLIDFLDVPGLYPKCSECLIQILPDYGSDIHKVWQFWSLCETYKLDNVVTEMCKYFACQISKTKRDDYFFLRELPCNLLAGVLALPSLEINDEVDVMSMIYDWITYCREERLVFLNTLFECIHVPSLRHTDQDKIKHMMERLQNTDINIATIYSQYMANPHKYFSMHPKQCMVRNGHSVIMTFNGVFSVPTPRQASISMMYADEDLVNNLNYAENTSSSDSIETDAGDNKTLDKKALSGNQMVFKSLKYKLRVPGKLTEFGICSFENYIYVVGGQHGRRHDMMRFAVNGAYRLDPNLGEWTEVVLMTDKRSSFFFGEIWGRLYAVGGINEHGPLDSVEYFDPLEDRWEDAPNLPNRLYGHAGCAFKEKLYICGGQDTDAYTDKLWILEQAAGPWQSGTPMLEARSCHAIQPLDNKLYVFGGCAPVNDVIKDIFSVEEYNTSTDCWTSIMMLEMPISCCLPVAVDNKILFIDSYSMEKNEYSGKLLAVDLNQGESTVLPLVTNCPKRVVGYKCLKMTINKKVLKLR